MGSLSSLDSSSCLGFSVKHRNCPVVRQTGHRGSADRQSLTRLGPPERGSTVLFMLDTVDRSNVPATWVARVGTGGPDTDARPSCSIEFTQTRGRHDRMVDCVSATGEAGRQEQEHHRQAGPDRDIRHEMVARDDHHEAGQHRMQDTDPSGDPET